MSVDPNWFKWTEKPRIGVFDELLEEFVKKNRLRSRLKWRRLTAAWEAAVGSETAGHSRVASFSNGRLTIEVDSPMLLQQLRGFRKREILRHIRQNPETSDVTDLRFKIGRSFSSLDKK